MTAHQRIPFVLGAMLLLGACTQGPATYGTGTDVRPVAEVGDVVITAHELRLDFELGLPPLKQGPDPVRGYLQGMIHERLLAAEGYRLGLDADPAVQRKVRSLFEELMVAQVFEQEVHAHVQVTDADIDSLRFREQVSVRLRFVPAANRADADRLRSVFQDAGHGAAVQALASAEGALEALASSELETDYLKPDDLDPEVLAAIDSLPMGEVSEPIPFRGTFLLVQVADIRREAATEVPRPDELERFTQVAFQRKAKAASRAFIQETMAGSGLRLKSDVYRSLERVVWNLHNTGQSASGSLLDRALAADGTYPADLLDQVVMETAGGSWTVRQFLEAFPVDRYPLSTQTYDGFRSDFYDAFGLVLRDQAFVARAEAAGYDRLPEVQEEIGRWESKWVYQALTQRVLEGVAASEEDTRAYFERHRSTWPETATLEEVRSDVQERVRWAKTRVLLEEMVGELAAATRILLHEDVLEDLDLESRAAPMTLFRGSTGRPAYPVLDYGL